MGARKRLRAEALKAEKKAIAIQHGGAAQFQWLCRHACASLEW